MLSDFTKYFQRLHQRADQGVKVPFREVSLEGWRPEPNKCHDNVDYWIKRRPGSSAVRGWIFWPSGEKGRYWFVAHSVVAENGELVDIAPIEGDEQRGPLLFLPHLGAEEEFELLKTRFSMFLYPPITQEESQEGQSEAEIDEDTSL